MPIAEDTPGSNLLYPVERKDKYDRAAQNASTPMFKQSVPPRRGIGPVPSGLSRDKQRDNPAMSFVMLTESQVRQPRNVDSSPLSPDGVKPTQIKLAPHSKMSDRVDHTTKLFEILSSRSDIDHPICTECTEIVLTALQARLSATTKERDAFINCLKDLKSKSPTEGEVAEAESELAAAKAEEKRAYSELLSLEKEKVALEKELAELDAESKELDGEEEEFWRSRNAFDLRYTSMKELKDSLESSYQHDVQQLERLRRTNVYNDTFCIGHDGHFGTINGLRLGRLAPPNNVEWAEINAAWGYTALLLKTVAQKTGFSFKGYVIKPMGSTSHIERLEYSQSQSGAATNHPRSAARGSTQVRPKLVSLELFSSGDLPVGRQILHRRFNEAMVAFLDCLKQLGDYVRSMDGAQRGDGLKLPYSIEKDKINGISIKLGASQDDQWTSACKYTLTCCKFLLAHASNEKNRREQ